MFLFGQSFGSGGQPVSGVVQGEDVRQGAMALLEVSLVPDLYDLITPSEVSRAPDLGSESHLPRSYCQGCCAFTWRGSLEPSGKFG